MRAVVLDGAGRPALRELPEPVGPGTRGRVLACGLCGSDVEKLGRAPAGTVLGHEVVAELADGRRVALVHHAGCGRCRRCRAGHETTCTAFSAPTIVPGGFAELVVAREGGVPVAAGLDEAAATLTEPLACVLRAVERVPRGRVLVVGCGSIGLLFVQVLLRRGDDVHFRDPRRGREERARRLGARPLGGSVDAAVLAAPGGLNEALSSLEPGGTLLVFAAPAEPVATQLDLIYHRELRLVGSRSATREHMQAAAMLLPELELPPLEVLPLARFAEGLERYRSGAALKVVFTP